MDPWLTSAAGAVAGAAGLSPDELRLSESDVRVLLDLARTAAHDSERTNAPLVCYLAGLAVARSGRSLDEVAGAVPGTGD
jgi:Domain of unknown function (DUF6457)